MSPFWKGSSSSSVAWKLYRATDSMALGVCRRVPGGSGLGAARTVRRRHGQETALMSALLPGHRAGPAAPQLPRCAAEAGEPCQPPRLPGEPCGRGWQEDLAFSLW